MKKSDSTSVLQKGGMKIGLNSRFRTERRTIAFLGALLFTSAHAGKPPPNQDDVPPAPVLSVQPVFIEGQRIVARLEFPASDWTRDPEQSGWPSVRINANESRYNLGLPPFRPYRHMLYLDLSAGFLDQVGSFGPVTLRSYPPGTYRVQVFWVDFTARKDARSVQLPELASNTAEFRVVAQRSPEAQALRGTERYEGRSIDEWLNELAAKSMEDQQHAVMALARIGAPAIPALLELCECGDPRGQHAAEALSQVGEEARGALAHIFSIAVGKPASDETIPRHVEIIRQKLVSSMHHMDWAAEEVISLLLTLARNPGEKDSIRRWAMISLGKFGEPAVPELRKLVTDDDPFVRERAIAALGAAYVETGERTENEYYAELIEADPFAPEVPKYLIRAKDGVISHGQLGKSHPLSDKVKALYRARLAENPDPQTAYNLAHILQTQLSQTALEWSINAQFRSGRSVREDPNAHFGDLESALTLCFERAEPDQPLWGKSGIGLAKIRLMRGDWEGMNQALTAMGQAPMPAEERPWLHAPPADWTDLRAGWEKADPSRRTGDAALELRFEKDGTGLAGVHVLLGEAKPPISSTGWIIDTLYHSPKPLEEEWGGSFGYAADWDRPMTRYSVSGDDGVVRFERLPLMDVLLEILIPGGNFIESGRDWDMLMETEPGRLRRISMMPDHDAIGSHEEVAQIFLEPGKTFHYPKIVVHPLLYSGVQSDRWTRADPSDYVLLWGGSKWNRLPDDVSYRIRMVLSAIPEPFGPIMNVPILREAMVTTSETEWPVGERGVGGLRLAPGNLYRFDVTAVDANGNEVSRMSSQFAWTPWPGREPTLPNAALGQDWHDLHRKTRPPIHHETWHRGNYNGESLDDFVNRWLKEFPDAFEVPYVRVGRAWLDWRSGKTREARSVLLELSDKLPEGNVARDTAASLLYQLDYGAEPTKKLLFVSTSGSRP